MRANECIYVNVVRGQLFNATVTRAGIFLYCRSQYEHSRGLATVNQDKVKECEDLGFPKSVLLKHRGPDAMSSMNYEHSQDTNRVAHLWATLRSQI
jgi:hypothetical protein